MQPTAELIWFRKATEFTRADRARALPLSAQAYHAFGTTSVFEEHGIANEVIRAYKDAYRDGTLTMRSALVFSPNWKAIGDAPLGPFMEAWAGWIGEPGLGDDWLKVTGLHVNIGRSPAEDVRATASPYTGLGRLQLRHRADARAGQGDAPATARRTTSVRCRTPTSRPASSISSRRSTARCRSRAGAG